MFLIVTLFRKQPLDNDPHALKAVEDALSSKKKAKLLKFAGKELHRIFLKDFPGAKLGELASNGPVRDGGEIRHCDRLSFSAPFIYADAEFSLTGELGLEQEFLSGDRVDFIGNLKAGEQWVGQMTYHRRSGLFGYKPTRKYRHSASVLSGTTRAEYLERVIQAVDCIRAQNAAEEAEKEELRLEQEAERAIEELERQQFADGSRSRNSQLAS
jgi:hypothetical protein